jgi:maltooligosyltrehalose trehalohydrolase
MSEAVRRLPVGAEAQPGGGVHFRVWAPRRKSVDVLLAGASVSLRAEPDGYFSRLVHEAEPGSTYRFRLDGGGDVPDPASRFQPEGPHGVSEVIDPTAFRWSDTSWRGVSLAGQVIYELHVGTFTGPGTFAATRARLPMLKDLGVTVLEIMPIADFPGRFGWGYDGVCLFAPTRLYGRPDDLRLLVDEAHACGLAVILDVVYNHLGPDGNYLAQFSDTYFTDRYETDWGEPLNFDGPGSAPVREMFLANAAYWIDEFHLDGLRLDATQNLYDASPEHLVAALTRRAREAARGRQIIVVGENEPQDVRLVQPPESGGYGLDGLWNDDLHHSMHVALTGSREAYYTDYLGSAQELVSALKHGFLYQGQRYKWQKKRRGTSTFGLPRYAFLAFVQNHDQVANSATGARVHETASPGALRAVLALVLLGPGTPMLFQGQEYSASRPFQYFADHHAELAAMVRTGRHQFLSQFPSLAGPEWLERLPDPAAPETFARCKLDHEERLAGAHAEMLQLHKDLLAWRRTDAVFQRQGEDGLDGAVLAPAALVVRFYGRDGDDRLLLVNLGADLHLDPAPEPLLAPPAGRSFELAWSSESVEYGGAGTAPVETDDGWHIPGQAAVLMRAGERRQEARTRFPPPRRPRPSDGEV